MNANTRLAICCYAGDQHRVIKALGQYLHHQCPVVVLSPEDSPAVINYPGIENRQSGKVGYIGQVSLDRMRSHLKTLLEFPEEFFLIHDDDSLCLSPELPRYLYESPEVLWSNQINNSLEFQWQYYPEGFPKIAFQSPYFVSRAAVEKLLASADQVQVNPGLPFIDHYMVQLALAAGCAYRPFPDGITCGTDSPEGTACALSGVLNGVVFVHAIKQKEVLDLVLAARQDFLRRTGG
jgi:hypothetical protein